MKKTAICALIALGLKASSLTVTPAVPQASIGSIKAVLIGPNPTCWAWLAPTGCEQAPQEQEVLVVVEGAPAAEVSIAYMVSGREETQSEAAQTFGADCTAEFVLPAGAELEEAVVTVASPAADRKGARRQ